MPGRKTKKTRNKSAKIGEGIVVEKVQINAEIPKSLRDAFKLKCVSRGISMSAKLKSLMEGYVRGDVI